MLTPVSPGVFAKKLVIVSTALLILCILSTRSIFYLIIKIIVMKSNWLFIVNLKVDLVDAKVFNDKIFTV